LHLAVELATFIFLDPNPDRVATDVVPVGEPKQADFAGEEFLRNLRLKATG
jgi:hypothetical protein